MSASEQLSKANNAGHRAAHAVGETLSDGYDRSRSLAREADAKVRSVVEQHPLACLAGAAAVGFAIARLVQRR